MGGLFPALRATATTGGVRITQRLRNSQLACYLCALLITDCTGAAYIALAFKRRWPLALPIILFGVAQVFFVFLFVLLVWHHCVVEVRDGAVHVRKRGRSTCRFPVDAVLDVAATRCDNDRWPGVRILHAAGFVVVFRGLGNFEERCEAARVLREALRVKHSLSTAWDEDEELHSFGPFIQAKGSPNRSFGTPTSIMQV